MVKKCLWCLISQFWSTEGPRSTHILGLGKNRVICRDVTTGATVATEVAPKFSDTLTLSQPVGADSAHHRRGRT